MSENPPELNALRFYITKRYGAEAEEDIMREATRLFGLVIASTKEQCARVARTAALEWKGEHGRSVAYAIEDAIRSLQITGEGK